ncbi:TPA: DUF551 domain-containing protein [Escherichia coli]|nr:DUF551 domain-containing protein [Escherichia coli]EGK3641162.1 DUF551 domain-containing protein [Escherichia coli]EHP7923421.1 DUF551 domain-containing protein [Escherichia coli]EIG9800391.1 DUF551 domain-containing protein [Escherichia coli]EIV7878523.1 DUF551 domain-containing protein [Escherichia coli]
MITITNKKQYPSEQYLNELITNIEFAARAPVEVVRAMAAELQKRREADSAEPVAYIFKHPAGKLFWALTDESNKDQSDVIPVYAAAPASVVPDNASEPLAYAYKELTPEIMRNHLAVFERYGIAPNDSSTTIQALRIALDGIERSDAMLHGAEPASNHEELPLDYLQGQKDGLEWAAQLAEANHPQTGDWLYDDPLELAKAIRKGPDMPEFDGPTPVTPDGWISCSERMPEDTKMLLAFSQGEIVAAYWNWVVNPIDYKKYRAFTYLSGNILDDVTHWMPLPEPPQEVK